MFLADDVVLFPFKSILFIFREIHKAALEEIQGEAEAIRLELSDLYRLLERGALSDDEFDRREAVLLDRLDTIEGQGGELRIDEEAGDFSEEDVSDDTEDDGDEDFLPTDAD